MESHPKTEPLEGIAIIGMAGRFPGASTVEALWKNLCEGKENITWFDAGQLHASVDDTLRSDPLYIRARGIIDGVDSFDEHFFRISPREAEMMDPQHRLFLELAWEALENAAYNPESYDGLIGVYGGSGTNTYLIRNLLPQHDRIRAFGEHQTFIVNAPDYLTSRVAYKFNLKGPAVSVYTGCSLSLVAVCLAFDALSSYQCDIALAGGVYVHCPQESGYLFQEGEIFSRDGHCRPFDAGARGTVFSNGGGIVVLKRYQEALEDGDCIYAVIRGATLNNDGSDKVSFLAPSISGQADLIATAHANAGIDPETISYVEAHGTGTPMGDPIEIEALTQAFRLKTDKSNFCAIGSIKGNIGHLDAAAGVAGLIKTALMLYHGVMIPSINYEQPNPNIDFPSTPFYVNTELKTWDTAVYPRRAGVSSFGVGGTNAHIILEEASTPVRSDVRHSSELLLFSAKTPTALAHTVQRYLDHQETVHSTSLSDAAYTLAVGRKHFPFRRALVCATWTDAADSLRLFRDQGVVEALQPSKDRQVVFMFSGQGAQYPSMGHQLYQTYPLFREEIDRCLTYIAPHFADDLRSTLFPAPRHENDAAIKLRQTSYTQPALFTVEYALARLLMSWGIMPQAMVGHSIGEYVAACLSGVFSLEEALTVVVSRGALVNALPTGAMIAVFLPEHELQPLLGEAVSIAAVNAPSVCTVSGTNEAIADFKRKLSTLCIEWRDLHTSHAFHSPMVEPILPQFIEIVKQVSLKPPEIPFLSNVTGTWITPEEAIDPYYWGSHVRHHVRFSDCIQKLQGLPAKAFVEIGPGRTLTALTKLHLKGANEHSIHPCLRHPQEQQSDNAFLLNTLGELWSSGVDVSWVKFYGAHKRMRVGLPTYPFERHSCWVEPAISQSAAIRSLHTVPETPKENYAPLAESSPYLAAASGWPDHGTDHILMHIWQQLLGVRTIDRNDNFFELGGSSVIAAILFAEIEQKFGKKLPLATLYSAPTIRQLANVIETQKEGTQWTSLVPIQPHGSKPPLFLVHGAGGNVLLYHDVSTYLGTDQPLYGLQSQGLDGVTPFLPGIEEMATHYLKEIQTVQPQGPYFLGGYCLGGTIAFEIAQQLLRQGQQVSLLILMETYNFSRIPSPTPLRVFCQYLEKIEFHLLNFFLLNPREKLVFVREKAKVANSRKKILLGLIFSQLFPQLIDNGSENWSYLSRLWNHNDRAATVYRPESYPGTITHFIPCRAYSHHRGDHLGWGEIAAGGVEVHQMPIYPGGMLVEPFVGQLAEKLRGCIARALSRDAASCDEHCQEGTFARCYQQ
ncbi:MAG TPA: beta-ketoacyl synthase N-terminal-like domain-containing protein [Thermodesulfobacteriota bacterium]|nr:beta-ketoacyl synthase N-terminal-like domain-containing protein [Thermodesulfobacteriota bacterium]